MAEAPKFDMTALQEGAAAITEMVSTLTAAGMTRMEAIYFAAVFAANQTTPKTGD